MADLQKNLKIKMYPMPKERLLHGRIVCSSKLLSMSQMSLPQILQNKIIVSD